jgi:hypothetical protein
VLAAICLPRLLELDRYVTPDEPKWLMRSANFYLALSQGSLRDTYQHEHPGVTTMWAGMLGFLRGYPNYIDIRPGQIEREEKLSIFLTNREISPLRLLALGRFFMVLAITGVLGLAFLVGCRLLGSLPAAIGILLVAFDPFFMALSRLLHVDGLMTALVLLSLLGLLCYLYCGHQARYLLLSGIAGGLSWLTKSPAFFLAPFVCLLALAYYLDVHQRVHLSAGHINHLVQLLNPLWSAFRLALAWLAIAVVIFTVLWPAMWVDPVNTLARIFSQAQIYAVEGHEYATFFNGHVDQIGESSWYFYPVAFTWRTSPPVMAGLILALAAIVIPGWLNITEQHRKVILVLSLFGLLFMIFMSFGAKKFDRYLLPNHVILDLVAAMGWVAAIETANDWRAKLRIRSRWLRWRMIFVYALIVALQLIGTIQTFPYYFNYYNPLLGGTHKAINVMMIGWGEGMDQAAAYLNQQPSADQLRVIAWYGYGPFSFFFKGQSVSMDVTDTLKYLHTADYVVLYLNQWQRVLPSAQVLDAFAQLTPQHIVRIGDLEYARIYDMHP